MHSSGNAPQRSTALFSFRGINKSYGSVVALQDANFDIYADEIHAIVGDNGAGKSTFLKVMAGAHQPNSGTITAQGSPVTITSPEAAMALGIATVYQNLALVDTRSAAQNVFMGREPTRWLMVDRRRMERETAEVLSTLVSKSFPVTALVGELSGGQRQAVAVSRAVHEQKKVILLDEPTAALGVQESHHVLDSILELKRQGKSLVVISHNLLHVFRVADRITVFRGGRVASTHLKDETTPDEIVTKITGADVL